MKQATKTLRPGDHVWCSFGLLFHAGIYVGNGEVIHNCPEHGTTHDTLEKFAAGALIRRGVSDRTLSRKQVVARAYSSLGERNYHLLLNNCLHFTQWCRTDMELT